MTSKSSGKGKVKTGKETSVPVSTPDWPPLKPLVPVTDLSLDTVLEDQIILIHNLLTSSLCRKYLAFLPTLPLVTTPNQPKKGDAMRSNDRFQVDDPVFAEQLWSSTGLKYLIAESAGQWGGEPCGLNPRIRIYRYRKGHFFDQHCKKCVIPLCIVQSLSIINMCLISQYVRFSNLAVLEVLRLVCRAHQRRHAVVTHPLSQLRLYCLYLPWAILVSGLGFAEVALE